MNPCCSTLTVRLIVANEGEMYITNDASCAREPFTQTPRIRIQSRTADEAGPALITSGQKKKRRSDVLPSLASSFP